MPVLRREETQQAALGLREARPHDPWRLRELRERSRLPRCQRERLRLRGRLLTRLTRSALNQRPLAYTRNPLLIAA